MTGASAGRVSGPAVSANQESGSGVCVQPHTRVSAGLPIGRWAPMAGQRPDAFPVELQGHTGPRVLTPILNPLLECQPRMSEVRASFVDNSRLQPWRTHDRTRETRSPASLRNPRIRNLRKSNRLSTTSPRCRLIAHRTIGRGGSLHRFRRTRRARSHGPD